MKRSICILFSLLAVCAAAQQQIPAPSPAAGTAFEDNQYRPPYLLGPGDQIAIRAAEAEEISGQTYRVDREGSITLPLVGKITAKDLTIEQLEKDLMKRLSVYVRNPQVNVNLIQYRSEPVFLVGAFKAPGVYQLQGRRSLLQVLALAGGLQQNAGRHIRVSRRKEFGKIPLPSARMDATGKYSVAEITIGSFQGNINPSEDIDLLPYDVIAVDRAPVIYVSGEVVRSGSIELAERDSLSLVQVLSLSGGFTRDASKKVHIIRNSSSTEKRIDIEVDMKKVMKGEEQDVALLPNDMLFVPRANGRATAIRIATIALAVTIPIVTGLVIAGRY